MRPDDRNYKQLHQISMASLLEESTHLKLVMRGIIAVIVLLAALIVWATFTHIEETSITYGEIMPKGKVQSLQHLEGGIVANVLVRNGDRVKKGELLIKLNDAQIKAELEQLRSREITLILNAERWRAFVEDKPANLVDWSNSVIASKYNTVKNKQDILHLLKDEQSHLESQYRKRADQKAILESTLAQRKEQLNEAEQQLKVSEKHIELLTKEFNMYDKLREKNLIAHKDYLVVLREMNKAQGDRTRLISQIQQFKDGILEAQNKLKELYSTSQENALKELGIVNDNLLELRHKIEKQETRLQQTNVDSPVDGTVKGLKVFPGTVVQPGGQLVEIVPYDQEYIVESRINPRDIGHIKVGDEAKIKILTYDYARYGSIKGKLTNISASTFLTEDGKPYYKATIELDKQYIQRRKSKIRNPLKTGMTVQADVITGEKTLLQYLLKPIHQSTSEAFHER